MGFLYVSVSHLKQRINTQLLYILTFLAGSVVKNPPANAGDTSSIPRSGKIPWRRKWQPFPVFLPGNPMDRGVWQATVVGLPRTQVPYILLLHSKFFPKYAKKKKKKKMALSDFTLSAQCFFYIIKADQKLTKKAAFGSLRLTLAFWTHTG